MNIIAVVFILPCIHSIYTINFFIVRKHIILYNEKADIFLGIMFSKENIKTLKAYNINIHKLYLTNLWYNCKVCILNKNKCFVYK